MVTIFKYYISSNKENKNNLKKAYKKEVMKISIKGIMFFLLIMSLLFLLILKLVLHMETLISLGIICLIAFLALILGYISFSQEAKKIYLKKEDSNCEIGFSEEDIKIIDSDGIISVKWNGVKEIKITKEYFVVYLKTSSIGSRIFLFEGFKEDTSYLISQIDKYRKIGGV